MAAVSLKDISIRTRLQSGEIGYLIGRQGAMYNRENGYGLSFESYIAKGMSEFHFEHDENLDRIWICEHQGQIIGSIMVKHRTSTTAQLRFFYIDPEYRGIGLGKHLMDLSMEFLRSRKFTLCYLWTTDDLPVSRSLYTRYGFKLAEEKPSIAFDKQLVELRFDLVLSPDSN